MTYSAETGNPIKNIVARNQMVVFVLLAYLLSWAFLIPAEGGLIPHGPMIAAFIVLSIVSGREGVSDLWKQMTRWRVNWRWYLIAPGIIILIQLFPLALILASGAQITSTAHLQSLPAFLGLLIPLVLLGGLWEEPGWIGFALRRFQDRFEQSPLLASLVTGLIRMFWHVPLLIYGSIPWYDFIFYSFSLQIILTWLYNRSRGSVLIAMIAHLFSNVMHATTNPLVGGADQELFWIMKVMFALAVGLGIVVATRGGLGLKSTREPAPAFSAGS